MNENAFKNLCSSICLCEVKHPIFGERRDSPRPVDVFALSAPLAGTRGVDGHGQVGGQRLTPLTERRAGPTHGARAEPGAAGVGVTVGVRPTLGHCRRADTGHQTAQKRLKDGSQKDHKYVAETDQPIYNEQ